jgi:hypothetical protein
VHLNDTSASSNITSTKDCPRPLDVSTARKTHYTFVAPNLIWCLSNDSGSFPTRMDRYRTSEMSKIKFGTTWCWLAKQAARIRAPHGLTSHTPRPPLPPRARGEHTPQRRGSLAGVHNCTLQLPFAQTVAPTSEHCLYDRCARSPWSCTSARRAHAEGVRHTSSLTDVRSGRSLKLLLRSLTFAQGAVEVLVPTAVGIDGETAPQHGPDRFRACLRPTLRCFDLAVPKIGKGTTLEIRMT